MMMKPQRSLEGVVELAQKQTILVTPETARKTLTILKVGLLNKKLEEKYLVNNQWRDTEKGELTYNGLGHWKDYISISFSSSNPKLSTSDLYLMIKFSESPMLSLIEDNLLYLSTLSNPNNPNSMRMSRVYILK